MQNKALQIFGFVMSFAYVFFGLLFLLTGFAKEIIEDPTYRKIFGGAVTAYGLFRVTYFLRKLMKKEQ